MSAPIGYLKAEIYGVPLIFDGKKWTYPDNFPACIDEYVMSHYFSKGGDKAYIQESIEIIRDLFENSPIKDLNEYKPWRHISHHTPLQVRAEIYLKETAGVEDTNWWIVECIPDKAWDKPLPDGAVD